MVSMIMILIYALGNLKFSKSINKNHEMKYSYIIAIIMDTMTNLLTPAAHARSGVIMHVMCLHGQQLEEADGCLKNLEEQFPFHISMVNNALHHWP